MAPGDRLGAWRTRASRGQKPPLHRFAVPSPALTRGGGKKLRGKVRRRDLLKLYHFAVTGAARRQQLDDQRCNLFGRFQVGGIFARHGGGAHAGA